MCQYFSHDVNAQNDDKCIRLIRELGWEGYGVFWGLIERMSGCEECQLVYNPSDLAWSMHVDEELLVRVITEFGFFVFSEDGAKFWSESARRRLSLRTHKRPYAKSSDDKPKRKRGRPRKNPLPDESQKETQETGEQNFTQQEEVQPAVTETPATVVETDILFDDEDYSQPNQGEEVIKLWNSVFGGTKQAYKGLALDAISYQRMKESFTSGFTIRDLEKAFQCAKADTFCWLLRDALKKDNIQRLLAKEEKKNELQTNRHASTDWDLPADWKDFVRGGDE